MKSNLYYAADSSRAGQQISMICLVYSIGQVASNCRKKGWVRSFADIANFVANANNALFWKFPTGRSRDLRRFLIQIIRFRVLAFPTDELR